MEKKATGRITRRTASAASTASVLRRKCVLITRPASEARRFSRVLRQQGFSTLTDPILDIVPVPGPSPDLTNIQGLVFTSANGVRAFVPHTEKRDIAVWAVGQATVRAAAAEGFSRIRVAPDANVQSLSRLIMKEADPAKGTLLYPSGQKVVRDLASLLPDFSLDRLVVYDARPAQRLSTRTRRAMQRGDLRCVVFFSSRTAGVFAKLAREAGCEKACRDMDAICISSAAATAADALDWSRTLVASRPGTDAILAKIDEAL